MRPRTGSRDLCRENRMCRHKDERCGKCMNVSIGVMCCRME